MLFIPDFQIPWLGILFFSISEPLVPSINPKVNPKPKPHFKLVIHQHKSSILLHLLLSFAPIFIMSMLPNNRANIDKIKAHVNPVSSPKNISLHNTLADFCQGNTALFRLVRYTTEVGTRQCRVPTAIKEQSGCTS